MNEKNIHNITTFSAIFFKKTVDDTPPPPPLAVGGLYPTGSFF
jgi:hypothetical protein